MHNTYKFLLLRAEWWLSHGEAELDIESEMRALKVDKDVGDTPRICLQYGVGYGVGREAQSFFCLLVAEAIK